MDEVAKAYRGCRERITGLAQQLDERQARAAVPACPEWTVHDVIAHLSGNVADAVARRLGGAGTDERTAERGAPGMERTRAGRRTAHGGRRGHGPPGCGRCREPRTRHPGGAECSRGARLRRSADRARLCRSTPGRVRRWPRRLPPRADGRWLGARPPRRRGGPHRGALRAAPGRHRATERRAAACPGVEGRL
ncbi:MAG: hypothetical protein E6G27_01770 [Actinobacteria bacterium]|nr:MAG: hypothetical protein E6G27_01770 [Actinomycetota bacterium]